MPTAPSADTHHAWIDAQAWRPDGGTDRSGVVVNPWTGATAAVLAFSGTAGVEAAVAGARAAFAAHRDATRAARSGWLEAAAAAIEADRDALVALMVAMIGKPRKAAAFEVGRSAAFLRACARHLHDMGGEVVPLDTTPAGAGRIGMAERVPHGVVLGVTPFNAPANLLVQKVGPAIATGNAIIVKPAPEGAAVALRIAHLFHQAGLPPGLFQVVLGDAQEALALAAHGGVDVVTLTGGTAAGEALARAAGIKPFLGELGGNSPNIVCADADIADAAARIAPSAFEASGQQCISTQRIIVDARVHDDFRAALLARTAALRVGDPALPDTDVGPVVHARSADRIMGMIEDAVADGATLLTDPARDGCLIHPTLLEGAPRSARIVQHEVFGPVAVLIRAEGVEDAIAKANDCAFGLQAACFTRDLDTAFRVGRALRVGSVWINEASRFRLDTYPFGGFGQSGSGREGVKYAMDEMTTWKFLGIRLPSQGAVGG
jgi:acyl-CoA reductase-like NAD-dependent aldehyde dehydrogenase